MEEAPRAVSRQGQDNVLVRLKKSQDELGYVSREALADIANSFGMSIGDVYGIATFYSFLSVKPVGRNVIRICRSLPCHLKDGDKIIESLSKLLGVGPGETTGDRRFTLELTNCIGACDEAPAMLVNGDLHGNLTSEGIAKILEAYK